MFKNIVTGFSVAMIAALAFVPAAVAEEEPVDVSMGVDYTIVTDYIWRGFNFSEYDGEGREKLNHQLDTYLGLDTPVGTFGAGMWFEWYAGNTSLDENASGPLQEVDYYVNYGNSFGPVSVEVGWILYAFPQLEGDAATTNEVYTSISLDDGGILNPSFSYYLDLDDVRGSWMEFGVSHDFALADVSALENTFLKDFTLTPSLTLGVDHRFSRDSTRLGNLLYGLDVGYDLNSALGIDEKYGSVSLTGFVNYSQSFTPTERDDEFFGGLTVSYAK